MWYISASYSDVVEEYMVDDDLDSFWEIGDNMIDDITENDGMTISIPSSALRDENNYYFSYLTTNSESTFFATSSITFIPVSCRYFLFSESDSYFSYEVFSNQGTEDLTFDIYLYTEEDCETNIFFDSLI